MRKGSQLRGLFTTKTDESGRRGPRTKGDPIQGVYLEKRHYNPAAPL